ncbi:type IV pilus assembly protein PilC [Clostridium tetanomorphum]|uniref:Type II secretion system protein GspF domain-containing protein n=1 Tax=Clostridium tetanomorphum TaxID=1553 RepID=A0A923E7C6_CLOTT|nr:type II secretion system F family protein [Clostridium tetanomorphum]KAJ53422.1 type II secretion system protein [Clostridium tetanomorphum DSM 665]MBC2396592.1 hypothetical protein [Clostridium tetanomorphum]MBP1863920.1 type IV pilus assembly protein PilC [Clostridium tetanomorphum]NRS84998.1 type IV pilus assembly protein PilC [Clostridium tetanomorphum]NRZ98214.1 type IV pilus assembly protein PilC [Clostridium tetanomorphum]
MKKKLSYKELFLFCNELSILLHSGISLPQSINLLKQCFINLTVKGNLENIKNRLFSGESLYSSINKYNYMFPRLLIEMIGIGEESGELPKVLSKISYYYKSQEKIKKELRKSLSYPIIISIISFVIIIFLLFSIIPKFINLLQDFKSETPHFSRTIFNIVNFTNEYIMKIIAFIIIIISIGIYLLKNSNITEKLYNVIAQLPYVGIIYMKLQKSRLFMAIGIMMSSGMNIVSALEKSSIVIKDKKTVDKIMSIKDLVSKGNSLHRAFSITGLFSERVIAIINIGEERGNLEEIFIRLSERYETEALDNISELVKFVEPSIIIVVSIVVGIIIVSILLPMLNIMDSLII